MAQPFPPQGNQIARTEKPRRVYTEQFMEGRPVPIGVVTDVLIPAYPNGEPRVYTPDGPRPIVHTEFVVTNRYTGHAMEVISAEEHEERFGGPPTVNAD